MGESAVGESAVDDIVKYSSAVFDVAMSASALST